MLANDSLYHDATIFDQLLYRGKLYLVETLPANSQQRWGFFFILFSVLVLCVGLATLLIGFQQTSQTAFLAHLLGALCLGATAYQFRQFAGQALAPPISIAPQPREERARAQTTDTQPAIDTTRSTGPRQFFRAVKAAGVNVIIARALYSGGVQSAEILNNKTDQELLAIHGVGPATVRKLRSHFTQHPDNTPA